MGMTRHTSEQRAAIVERVKAGDISVESIADFISPEIFTSAVIFTPPYPPHTPETLQLHAQRL